MNIAEIKAAVDAGKPVHWANEGYRVYRDSLGQYLITFMRNGSSIALPFGIVRIGQLGVKIIEIAISRQTGPRRQHDQK